LSNFITSGFEAIVVVAKADLFGEEWLGRKIDSVFLSYLNELRQRHNIQLCGEAGEYHTFVTDGPLFNQSREILETDKILREGYRFLEDAKYALRVK
jgi:diphthamide synthase (EF-2-diphthine--ammonia ligase)